MSAKPPLLGSRTAIHIDGRLSEPQPDSVLVCRGIRQCVVFRLVIAANSRTLLGSHSGSVIKSRCAFAIGLRTRIFNTFSPPNQRFVELRRENRVTIVAYIAMTRLAGQGTRETAVASTLQSDDL